MSSLNTKTTISLELTMIYLQLPIESPDFSLFSLSNDITWPFI